MRAVLDSEIYPWPLKKNSCPLSFFLPYSLDQIFPELLVAGAFGRVGRPDTSAVQVRIDFLAALGSEGIIKIGFVFILTLKLEL